MADNGLRFKAVRTTHMGFYPAAECDTEGCDWSRPPSGSTLQAVKDHCAITGHVVIVVREERSRYEGQLKAGKS